MINKNVKATLKQNKIIKFNSVASYKVLFSNAKKYENKENEVAVSKTKRRKTTWIFLLINLVIVAGIFIYQFTFNETKPLSELFGAHPFYRYFSIALGVLVLFYIVEALTYSILLKQFTGRFNFWLGLKIAIVGKYWDSITPFGSGGQFAQIAYSNTHGNSGDVSTSVVVGKFMLWQIAFVSIGVVVLFVPIDIFGSGQIVKILALVGVLVNVLMFVFVWSVSTSRKFCSVIVVGGLKLLRKMHIIKDYRKSLYNSMRFIKNYQTSIKAFAKKPLVMISEVLLDMIGLIAMAFIAYLIYLAFEPYGKVSPITIVGMSFLCTFATAFIPIPGGSGAAEISFATMFGSLFSEGVTFWALIMWRIYTFYLYIVIGIIFTVVDTIVSNKQREIRIKK